MTPRPWALAGAAWLALLWVGAGGRAADPGDPSDHLVLAARAADVLRDDGPRAWLAAVAADFFPAQTGLLSGLIALGLPPTHGGYKAFVGAAAAAALLFFILAVERRFGARAAWIALGLTLASNAAASYAFYGGHNWLGQAYFWAAWWAFGTGRRPAWTGTLAGLAVLSSYHLMPLAGMLLVAAAWEREARGRLELAVGALAPLAVLEVLTLGIEHRPFWATVAHQVANAPAGAALRAAPGYSLRWLFSLESPVFAATLLAAAAAAAHLAARGARLRGAKAWAWIAAPAGAWVFFELPGMVKLGRFFLPLLPFAVAWAADAAARGWDAPGRRARAAVLAAGCALLGFQIPLHLETRSAFWAGGAIERAIGDAPLYSLGRTSPYVYLPGRETSFTTRAQLNAILLDPGAWVLVSPFSNWWNNGFVDESHPQAIPVGRVYASDAPYVEVPGVESLEFMRFTNEGLHAGIARGEIPFPVNNRLYRARDLARACCLAR